MSSCAWLSRFDNERRRGLGCELIGGVDEAGRGPLAGPVVAACVVLAPGTRLPGLDDSKQLDHATRARLAPQIIERAAAWGIGWATAAEIDRINILQATLLAARRAMSVLAVTPQHLITDYLKLPEAPCAIEPIVGGDRRSQAVAAASVLAKVARDRIMTALDAEYPDYGFASHKGYAVPVHWAALRRLGPCTLHRLSFNGVGPAPFFGSEPAPELVRCRSHRDLATCESRPADTPDWLHLMSCSPDDLNPLAFLPECEWQREPMQTVQA